MELSWPTTMQHCLTRKRIVSFLLSLFFLSSFCCINRIDGSFFFKKTASILHIHFPEPSLTSLREERKFSKICTVKNFKARSRLLRLNRFDTEKKIIRIEFRNFSTTNFNVILRRFRWTQVDGETAQLFYFRRASICRFVPLSRDRRSSSGGRSSDVCYSDSRRNEISTKGKMAAIDRAHQPRFYFFVLFCLESTSSWNKNISGDIRISAFEN